MNRIYLDANASTPVAPEVRDAMLPYLDDHYGNPSGGHWAAVPARRVVEMARGQVARLLACDPEEVVFTSGGSESNNQVLKGILLERDAKSDGHIVTTSIEHPSVIETCRFLERLGTQVSYLPVDGTGRVDPDDVLAALRPGTRLVSVMHANNEVGTIQPITDIATLTEERGIPLHTDAAQSVGKVPVELSRLGTDLLTVAGHKMYAPKGVGALVVRRGMEVESLVHGGGHESGRRAGTESAALAVALGAACALAERWVKDRTVRELRDRFWDGLRERFGDRVVLNGHPTERLPNTLNVSFPGHAGSAILARLDGVAASTGSACHTGREETSPVLAAMGVPDEVARGAIRFSLTRTTTSEEIEEVIRRLAAILAP